jgi:predicted Zn-dependent protease
MEAHANLGEAYIQCKQLDAAVRQLQWAVQLHPEEPWLYRTLALAHWKRSESSRLLLTMARRRPST